MKYYPTEETFLLLLKGKHWLCMSLYSSVYEALQSNVKWHVRVLAHYKPVFAVYILSNGEIWTVFPGGRTALNCSGIFPSSPANLLYVSEESAGKPWAWNRIGQTFPGGSLTIQEMWSGLLSRKILCPYWNMCVIPLTWRTIAHANITTGSLRNLSSELECTGA